MPTVNFRFHAELDDFLPAAQRNRPILHTFHGNASVKDRIEALGIPHPEVAAIVVNGLPVSFDYLVQDSDAIDVYPISHLPSPVYRALLRPPDPEPACFVLDIHLGKLANYLRMLGFDTLYRNDYEDEELAEIASNEERILLTRDLGVLKRREVTYGYYVRSLDPRRQVGEVLHRFDLFNAIDPFHRCLGCNGLVVPVDKEEVLDQLQPKTRLYYDEFYRCCACNQVYWKGSHFERMQRFIGSLHRFHPREK